MDGQRVLSHAECRPRPFLSSCSSLRVLTRSVLSLLFPLLLLLPPPHPFSSSSCSSDRAIAAAPAASTAAAMAKETLEELTQKAALVSKS